MGHLHNDILIGSKKEEKFTFCDSMDGTGKHYAKSEKDKCHIISLMCGI